MYTICKAFHLIILSPHVMAKKLFRNIHHRFDKECTQKLNSLLNSVKTTNTIIIKLPKAQRSLITMRLLELALNRSDRLHSLSAFGGQELVGYWRMEPCQEWFNY